MKPQATRSEVPKGRRVLERALAGAAVALVAALALGATGARAGDFEDAFEHELGRLAAQNVVAFGHFIFAGPHYAHQEKRSEPYRLHGYYRGRRHPRPHPHWYAHRHDHHGRPCNVVGRHYHHGLRVVREQHRHARGHHQDDYHARGRRERRHAAWQVAYHR